MDGHEAWEPRAALLEAAVSAGFKLSESQLGRLHRAGVLPGPRVRMLGRGKGTVSEFPPGTSKRLLRVLAFQAKERNLSVVAWRMWWEDGGALPAAVRARLARIAEDGDRLRNESAGLIIREEDGDNEAAQGLEEIDRAMESGRLSGVMGAVRRSAGRQGISTLGRILLEVMAGRFETYGDDIEDPAVEDQSEYNEKAALVDRALGSPIPDRLTSLDQQRFQSSEAVFTHISKAFSERSLSSYLQVEDEAIDRARAEISGFLALVAAAGPLIRRLKGASAIGSAVVIKALDLRDPGEQALAVLGWLVLRHDAELVSDMGDLIALLPKARATIRLDEIRTLLAEEVPELAVELSDQSHRRAIKDADYAKQRARKIAEIADEHRGRVDAFMRAHPEIDELTAIIGQRRLEGFHSSDQGQQAPKPVAFTRAKLAPVQPRFRRSPAV